MQDLKRLLNDSWKFFLAHLLPISFILLPGLIVANLVGLQLEAGFRVGEGESIDPTIFWYAPIMALIYAWYHGAVVFYIASAVNESPDSMVVCYQKALLRLPMLFLLHFISGFAILMGLALLIIPGVVLMVRLQFSDIYCLLRGQGPIASFKQSLEATKRDRWLIFWGAAIIYSSVFGLTMIVSSMLASMDLWNTVVSVLFSCIEGILLSLLTIFAYRMFVRNEQLSQQADSDSSSDELEQ